MRKVLFLVAALLLSAATLQAQTFFQGFDNAATNNWNYTPTPAAYNFPSLFGVWADTTALGANSSGNILITAAAQGTRFWGISDIENPHSQTLVPAPYVHTINFATLTLTPTTNYILKFKYFTHIFSGSGDSVGYIIEYNNGTTWNMSNYVGLVNNKTYWDSVVVNVPANTQYLRLQIRTRVNGNDDYVGLDAFQVAVGTVTLPANVTLAKNFLIFDEASDTAKIPVVATNRNANPTSVNISLAANFGTTDGSDINLLTPMITWTSSSPDTQYAMVKINNDALAEVSEYFALELTNPSNATLGSTKKVTSYIRDNDYTAPAARKNIELQHLGSYSVPMAGSSAEIVAYDSVSNRLFVVNSLLNYLHILSFANPSGLTAIDTINMAPYGSGINSVAARNGIVAVAVEANPKTDSGKVVFLDTAGNFLKEVKAGAMPDMITFTPDGKYVLTANEGEPNSNYSIDPEGSVTIVDMQNGVSNATSSHATFTSFNGMEAALKAQGIRIYGPGANAAKDFEPEYIALSKTSDTAWVTLQENNAIATLHIPTNTIIALSPLGYVNHMQTGNAIDGSDNNGTVLIANWPVRGMYLPDAIASFNIGGATYLVSANEGDARDYSTYAEEARIGSGGYTLDPVAFPHADLIKANHNLGRLNAVTSMGDVDNDGDFDQIYVLGGRSFSIWNATGGQVFNSGDQLEQITLADPKFGKIFNADNGGNASKNRSDNKGPEPEGVATGVINDTTYAFVAIERTGGVMVYDVSDPQSPVFVQYINTRDTGTYGGDNGTEGIIFVHAGKNIHNKHYVITANEVSGTVAVFEVKVAEAPTNSVNNITGKTFNVYPNPVSGGRLFFSQPLTGKMFDMNGRAVRSFDEVNSMDMNEIAAGTYILKAEGFETRKIMVQ